MPLPCIDPALYPSQLAAKVARFREDFAPLGLPEPQVFASAPLHYRLRAEFRIWHQGGSWEYAMFDPDAPRRPILMRDFPAASAAICALMPRLREGILASERLNRNFYAVEFLSTLSGDMLVTLIYKRSLDAAWEEAARALAAQLGIAVIGRSRGQKLVLERDWVQEAFELEGRQLRYRQFEGGFSQPNGGVNLQMLGWARSQARPLGGDLLELYCGNGNFTLALAPLFERVLATEVSKTSIHAAQYNRELNGAGNVALVRMASEEISAALAGRESFERLRQVDLAAHNFSTLFVDPPRSGLDPATLELARGFPHILYISCNPQTLLDNARALADSHRIAAAAVFDQFPYTHHLETGLLLQRRS
ncbi:tRNA (uridine(54)-C5)-methyltransferase TrmA [Azovibrio restrictus]|uniref:tRNA (uridine(54)-C5)-methyltransferase TrmA n=1 Tax=Azovibrio restrictus TaxID=146938 RepID=UPI0026E9784E|nr:tRNA (uridine(54)-C5)-methyltransferase TrmA [Azovibrio restrictus]MDD3482426.1 tRNA (uridine(54)-C5)-methyltransferase TrmA [Azovibrio restrictus]